MLFIYLFIYFLSFLLSLTFSNFIHIRPLSRSFLAIPTTPKILSNVGLNLSKNPFLPQVSLYLYACICVCVCTIVFLGILRQGSEPRIVSKQTRVCYYNIIKGDYSSPRISNAAHWSISFRRMAAFFLFLGFFPRIFFSFGFMCRLRVYQTNTHTNTTCPSLPCNIYFATRRIKQPIFIVQRLGLECARRVVSSRVNVVFFFYNAAAAAAVSSFRLLLLLLLLLYISVVYTCRYQNADLVTFKTHTRRITHANSTRQTHDTEH